MTAPRGRTVPVQFGVEWWPEPMEQPGTSVVFGAPARPTGAAEPAEVYDVDPDVLRRWQEARREYLQARAALVGQLERQGWRAPADRVQGADSDRIE